MTYAVPLCDALRNDNDTFYGKKDIVTNNDGQYYIYDYFLFHWLNRK